MDNKNLNKRASSSGGGFSEKRSNFSSFRDTKNSNNGISIQSCNRLGCSTRYNNNTSIKGDGISNNNTDKKLKNPKSILCTSTNKFFLNGSSSKSSSSNNKEQKKLKSVSEFVPAESSSSEVGFVECAATSGNSGQSSVPVNLKSGKGPSRQVLRSSSLQGRVSSLSSREPREVNNRPTVSSISDASSSGCSSSTMPTRCTDTQRKRSSPNASSSSSTKGNLSSYGTRMNFSKDHRNQVVGNRLQPSTTSQRTRNQPAMSKDNEPSLVTTQRTTTVMNQPARVPVSGGEPSSSITRPPRLSLRESTATTTGRTGLGGGAARSSHIHAAHIHEDNSMAQMSHAHGSLQHFNTNEISQVLLALEMIDYREELTHEQRLALESNLILGALGYQDQHRDMRLDIDDMSYEELLDLGEKMGTVSTALTEEALVKCIRRSTYGHNTSIKMMAGCSNCADDEIKCSICQEEYVAGDEVGKLICEHLYHVTCIYQWLRKKNWCPICKAFACPLSRSRSSSLSIQ